MRKAVITGAVCCLCAALGCSSTRYSATTLPAEFAAPVPRSAHKVDLSKLARPHESVERIQPGDSILVTIATGIETREPIGWKLRVADDGSLNVPIVGPVAVGGAELTEAERRVAQEAIGRGKYVNPRVTLKFEQRRTRRVTVMGAVMAPDTYELPLASSDLLTALAMAEGLTPEADTFIEIRHSSQNRTAKNPANPVQPAGYAPASSDSDVLQVDLTKADQLPPGALELYDGSVVVVRERDDSKVSVLGLVRKPGTVTMPEGEDMFLLQAVADAGGTTMSVADKIKIIRQMPDGQQVVFGASLRAAKQGGADNVRLAAGDVISVEETPLTATLGAIQTFFRVGFSAALPGM